jgi:hypothetical protein
LGRRGESAGRDRGGRRERFDVNRDLAPPRGGVWSERGPAGASLAVGLFGPGAMWAADSMFASQAGFYLRQQLRGTAGRRVDDPTGAWTQLVHEEHVAQAHHGDGDADHVSGPATMDLYVGGSAPGDYGQHISVNVDPFPHTDDGSGANDMPLPP